MRECAGKECHAPMQVTSACRSSAYPYNYYYNNCYYCQWPARRETEEALKRTKAQADYWAKKKPQVQAAE